MYIQTTTIPDIFVFEYDNKAKKYISKKISAASANAAMFGVPKMFTPVWLRWPTWSYHEDNENNKIFHNRTKREHREHYYEFLNPINWTYFYDHSALEKTLD